MLDPAIFAARRRALVNELGDGVYVFPSAPVAIRNNDVEHDYRQDSDLFYLTGFAEPGTTLVMAEGRALLFVPERNKEREIWDGPRAGVEGAVERFGMDRAFPNGELEACLKELFADAKTIFFRVGHDHPVEALVFRAWSHARRVTSRTPKHPPSTIVDPSVALAEQRMRKSVEELALMRRACAITTEAHRAAMSLAAAGRYEYELEAVLLQTFRRHGSERPAYGCIVGSGPNATILHYRSNNRCMEAGDLVLIDAGCELGYYASDVTRTFPVSGRFSPAQRSVYEVVLKAQEAAIEATRPGANLRALHDICVRELTAGMVSLGLLTGEVDALIEREEYKSFYMHRSSHWLGMDVHDVGRYCDAEGPRALEPGFVFTIEPGLYIATDADVPKEFRGIGVRIEDDILVTADGCENLSVNVPKSIADIEATCLR